MEEKNIEQEQHHDPIEDLVKELEKIGSLEEKIAHLFQWMQTALSHHPTAIWIILERTAALSLAV